MPANNGSRVQLSVAPPHSHVASLREPLGPPPLASFVFTGGALIRGGGGGGGGGGRVREDGDVTQRDVGAERFVLKRDFVARLLLDALHLAIEVVAATLSNHPVSLADHHTVGLALERERERA